MKFVVGLVLCLSIVGWNGPVAAAAPPRSDGGTFTTFDLPGSPGYFFAINPEGAITGYYFDAGGLLHSFLRAPDGTITAFDPPGATCSFSTSTQCSAAVGITPEGTITGTYQDAHGTFHGFLRAPDGTFTTFDPPGSTSTGTAAINPKGVVTGSFFGTGSSVLQSFLRTPDGAFTTFDVPGATYTQAFALSPVGAITGWWCDASFSCHGFLRAPAGAITTFDAPPGFVLTNFPSFAITPAGAITGTYCDPNFNTCHGFLRDRAGTLTTVDAPGLNYGTFPTGITPAGAITGYNIRADFSGQDGFLRAPNGTVTTFDPPGAQFTMPLAINPAGAITGWWCDASFSCHGFLRTP